MRSFSFSSSRLCGRRTVRRKCALSPPLLPLSLSLSRAREKVFQKPRFPREMTKKNAVFFFSHFFLFLLPLCFCEKRLVSKTIDIDLWGREKANKLEEEEEEEEEEYKEEEERARRFLKRVLSLGFVFLGSFSLSLCVCAENARAARVCVLLLSLSVYFFCFFSLSASLFFLSSPKSERKKKKKKKKKKPNGTS